MVESEYMAEYEFGLEKIERWARSQSLKLVLEKPLTDAEIDELPLLIKPHFGEITFHVPRSFRAFLKVCSSARLKQNDGYSIETDFWIYEPQKMAEITHDVVHVPEDVAIDEQNGPITTNHLIGFAATDASPDCNWCFRTDRIQKDGEVFVCIHDQDEPVHAKFIESGHDIDPRLAQNGYPSFYEWFKDYVNNICAMKMDHERGWLVKP